MDGLTDGRTDRRTDGGDYNIPFAFLKKRGDKYRDTLVKQSFYFAKVCDGKFNKKQIELGPNGPRLEVNFFSFQLCVHE